MMVFSRKSAREYSKVNAVKEYLKENPLKNIRNQIHEEYLSKNLRKLPAENICKTILPEHAVRNFAKKNTRTIFEQKSPLKENRQVCIAFIGAKENPRKHNQKKIRERIFERKSAKECSSINSR